MAHRYHEPIDALWQPRVRGWLAGTEVISSIFGLVIFGMVLVAAVGVTWNSTVATGQLR